MRAALLLFIFIAFASNAAAAPFDFTVTKVADGIHAFIETPGHSIVSGNITVIEGDDGLAIVDTGHHPALTARIVAAIRVLTPKPVLYVVNTHWHNDHAAGNFVFAEAFPQARFIAHRFTAQMLEQETRVYQGPSCEPFIHSQTKELRGIVANGALPDGTPVAEARLTRMKNALADADAALAECKQFRFRGADIAFEESLALRLGKRDVQVMFLGRANTAGDAVVYVPDAKVAAVGDILVHPFPFAFQSYIGEWAKVLRRIEALAPVAVVPGHGPVMRDMIYLRDIASLMESIDGQVRAAYKPGMALDAIRAHVDLAEFRRRIAGDDPVIQANFDAGVAGSAVQRAWEEVSGSLKPEGLPRF